MRFLVTAAQAIIQGDGRVERPRFEVDAEDWQILDGMLIFYTSSAPPLTSFRTQLAMPVDQVLAFEAVEPDEDPTPPFGDGAPPAFGYVDTVAGPGAGTGVGYADAVTGPGSTFVT